MSIFDPRAKLIITWLTNTLNLDIINFEPASSDASFRRYFRVTHEKGSQIVMDAPPEKEDIKPFIRIATFFKKAGINVPKIVQQDLEQGFLLLEDFGSLCYLDRLTEENATTLYLNAFNSLYEMQTKIVAPSCQLPCYDEELLGNELNLFFDWFLEKYLSLSIPEDIKNKTTQVLIASALEQPQVCVHRDFHSRNLMFLDNDRPGIIDFQDAVIGPVTYDLVSLLRDCYIAWPQANVQQWMMLYFEQISTLNLTTANLETFTRWFDLMGLQRHLKAIGIFSRLHLRDNKSNYLQDIPLTMNYVVQICNEYPELKEFSQFLNTTILSGFNKVNSLDLE